MRSVYYFLFPVVTIGLTPTAYAQAAGTTGTASDSPEADGSRETTWHSRLGVGLNPVISSNDNLPNAHLGFGASISGFIQLPYRLSTGLAFDWDRYTFDSKNHGDPYGSAARYSNEVLTQSRLMALLQWDVLARRSVTPFVLAGLGYGWQDATLTQWQCHPSQPSGLVLGVGAGLDLALNDVVGVGVEYRLNTLPYGLRTCTLAQIDTEPMGPPTDVLWQRIAITVGVRN